MPAPPKPAAADSVPPRPAGSSGWNRAMVRGVRPHDLAGKAGDIAAELEDRLIRGSYRFGETLSIYTLAGQFGASRQPVAAAVLYLKSVGYLDVIPQVGCRVVSPSAQEVHDFHVLFSRTEAVIGRFAAERHRPEEAAELIAMAEDLAANRFASAGDRRRMADGIALFHDQISGMSRSQLLVDRISNLRRIFRFYLSQQRPAAERSDGPPVRMNALRLALAVAIRDRDAAGAEQATSAYILDVLDDWARVV